MKIKFIILLFLIQNQVFAYVTNQTTNGINIRWPAQKTLIDVYVNPQNNIGLNQTSVQNTAQASLNQWNGVSKISTRFNNTIQKNQNGFNEIFFSNDPVFFGGNGVKGVTQVSYRQDTGEILEADILIDDVFSTFSLTQSDENFLGNVFTHEIGHLLGLGHGQVLGSTMFYEMSFGQSELADDDKAGLFANYELTSLGKKSINGQIVGGRNLTPAYGVHIQAISLNTGQVAAATISDFNGNFSIQGLSSNDQYYLYTKPLVPIGLPTNFDGVKNNFCDAGKSFRGSFFQACGASGEGHPQAIKLTTANINVGKITIRCSLDVPPDYIQQKGTGSAGYTLDTFANGQLGNSFVGYFSTQELNAASPIPDQININLSGLTGSDWNNFSTLPLYLEVRLINQLLFSPYKLSLQINRPNVASTLNPVAIDGVDGFLNLDIVARVAIDRATLSENDFTLLITPHKISSTLANYFPSQTNFQDSMYFYLANFTLVTPGAGGSYLPVSSKNYQVSDNSSCPDAMNTYAVLNSGSRSVASTSDTQKKAFACGSIDLNNDDRGGPTGFFVGLLSITLLVTLKSRIRYRL